MKIFFVQLLILMTLVSCSSDDDSSGSVSLPQEEEFGLDIFIDRTDVIWGFEFLPDNRIIFTERSGNILLANLDGTGVVTAGSVPGVAASGEGGLLDLRLHPDFNTNNQVYFCYSTAAPGGRTQALGRATLSGNTLTNFEQLFTAGNGNGAPNHFGCRIEFINSTQLFLTTGEQAASSRAQDANSLHGKILRMNADGTNVEVWSSGHRNPQGLATNPDTNELYSSEHGPSGGDEINIIRQGENYGWPLVTRGQPPGPLGESAPGFVDPIISWSPSIAPSGIAFWRGNLFVATLRGQHIRRLVLSGAEVVSEQQLFGNLGLRFRNLRTGPDGLLYFSTDDGKIGRLTTAR